jgi:putative membrane protein insertion efficiency factor
MKYPLLALIKLYQWTISPLLGPVCKYYPSCSHYGYQAIDRHGAIKGFRCTLCGSPLEDHQVDRPDV